MVIDPLTMLDDDFGKLNIFSYISRYTKTNDAEEQLFIEPSIIENDDPSTPYKIEGSLTHEPGALWREGQLVKAKDLQARSDLNGATGTIKGYNPSKGRYIVVFNSDPTKDLLLKSSNLTPALWMEGQLVKAKDLQARSDLNGATGTIKGYNPSKSRYIVVFNSDPTKDLLIKSSNLTSINYKCDSDTGLKAVEEADTPSEPKFNL